jgi:GGDEF domain-containing protein
MDLSLAPLPRPRGLQFAPVLGLNPFGALLAGLLALLAGLYAMAGSAKPPTDWQWVDLLSEGGLCAMLAIWLGQLRASRPAGPVTSALALGLAAWLLGAGVDLLDELWQLPKTIWWDNLLESGLVLIGMGSLTWGLHGWRQEQLVLAEQRRRRERGTRDLRREDPVTQLADADYMAAQIERERRENQPGWLLMLGFEGFDRVVREAGLAEADRLLMSAGQLLCLNLGVDELVCRYGGDRFVVLLPLLHPTQGQQLAATLQRALASLSHADTQGRRWQLGVRAAGCALDGPQGARELMLGLAARLN